MSKRAVFSMAELVGTVWMILEPYLGSALELYNPNGLVVAYLEHYFYGTRIPPAEDIGYYLPTEVSERLKICVENTASQAILVAFGIQPTARYTFKVSGNDIYIIQTIPEPDLPELPQHEQEDDCWMPERIREKMIWPMYQNSGKLHSA